MDDENRQPRRSQSHGSLRSNYSRHARPLHRPLTRVNENSSLLSSSAALGGMLKTTTETGDIGLYSIQSVPGTSLGTPSRARNTAGRRYPSRHPPRRSVDKARRFEGPRRYPLMSRDATSEIISMYGSNSQSSVNSTRATSYDEPGQRSLSMTTAGLRHLSHNKSNTTLQSQASSGPLQRPRSPFPYPTRLPRPGARPVSPAVTDAGIVDYSRMVEIDRISLRTGHGPYKSSYQPSHRRPPQGVRVDANTSMPSLHAPLMHGQMPPPMRRAPGPPSIRTASAASIASWNTNNTSFRNRVDSAASRTSSLTSVVDMYYRMPPAVRAAQLGHLAPSPRYYDYTEEFENKLLEPSPSMEPVAPVPTRAANPPYPLVLREGSEKQVAEVFSAEVESAFDRQDSQSDDSQAETEPHLLSDVDLILDSGVHEQEPVRAEGLDGVTTDKEESMPAFSSSGLGPRKLTHGSDIDRLPSQIGRASVDTFRPSFDVESKSVPLFSYPKFRQSVSHQTNTPSPAQQVQVHGGKARSIRSEQGVILQGNPANYVTTDDESELEEYDAAPNIATGAIVLSQISRKRHSRSDLSNLDRSTFPRKAVEETQRQTSVPGTFSHEDRTAGAASRPEKMMEPSDHRLHAQASNRTTANMVPPVPPKISGGLLSSSHRMLIRGTNDTIVSGNKTPQHKSANLPKSDTPKDIRKLEIVKNRSFQGNEINAPLTPSCSMAPLVAPHPISPVRELRVKNSIPQLMKALPPLPGQPGYVPPSPPTTTDDDDDFAQILRPYTSLDNLKTQRKAKVSSNILTKPLPDIQKKFPKIRIKPKVPGLEVKQTYRESRPWNSDSNYPWSTEAPEIELADIRTGQNDRASLKRRVRLRGSRTVCSGTPVGTVRRNPKAQRSEPAYLTLEEQPRDLFSVPSGLANVFRQVSRKFSQGSDSTTIKRFKVPSFSSKKSSIIGAKRARSRSTATTDVIDHRNVSSGSSRVPVLAKHQHRGLGKRFSNLKSLLARDKHVKIKERVMEETEFLHGKRQTALDSRFGLGSIDSEGKTIASGRGLVAEAKDGRLRFRRRMKTRFSRWMRGTKPVLVQT